MQNMNCSHVIYFGHQGRVNDMAEAAPAHVHMPRNLEALALIH